MARPAVLTGRTLADLVRDVFVVLVIWAVCLLVGFRPAGNPLAWLEVLLGLVSSSPVAVQGVRKTSTSPLLTPNLVLRPVWWMMSFACTGFFPLKSVYRL